MSPALATKFFTTSAIWEVRVCVCVCVCVSHLIYSLIHWWTPKLFPYPSAIVNNATMNMWVQIISSIFCSHFLCIYTQKWNCSSNGSSVSNFFEEIRVVYHGGHTNLHSCNRCTRILFSLNPQQHFLFVVFFLKIFTFKDKYLSFQGFLY